MIVAGITMPSTRRGMKLNDGGCAIIKDGNIYAIAEERISRKKHASGFELSLKYCLEAAEVTLDEVDLFVVSSCCEEPLEDHEVNIKNVPGEKIIICKSHHFSHALSTFCMSGYDEALIMIIDNEGNILNDDNISQPFHKRRMEHMSYYIGNSEGVKLLERDEVPLNKIGIGDAYRYFTHYLGFPSYVYAGKVMGLAAYGDEEYCKNNIFTLENGHITCEIENNYTSPNVAISSFLEMKNISSSARNPIDEITKDNAKIARWIQSETERILVEKVKYLVEKTNIKNLCIAGGVGLNSVANAQILRNAGINELFILPAAGDSGQCLGNALYGEMLISNKLPKYIMKDAYFGKKYSDDIIEKAIETVRNDSNFDVLYFEREEDLLKKEAELLWDNLYVGHYDGRSEFGPRALGNRSILANPCSRYAKDDLNRKIKFRESFRPFAPIVLYEKADRFFEIDRELPFMLVVTNVIEKELLPAITHVDGTARIQTITDCQNKKMCNLLREFEKISGVPVLLNTSFNVAGEPIVESPQDAIKCLKNTALNALAMGKYLVIKKECQLPRDEYIEFITSLGKNL